MVIVFGLFRPWFLIWFCAGAGLVARASAVAAAGVWSFFCASLVTFFGLPLLRFVGWFQPGFGPTYLVWSWLGVVCLLVPARNCCFLLLSDPDAIRLRRWTW